MNTVVKLWITGGITGIATALCFVLVSNLFSTDGFFHLWEFGISSVTPAIVAVVIAKLLHSSITRLFTTAYLTLLFPVLGPLFGGTGSEPIFVFAILGCTGGLFWSMPFGIWKLIKK